MCCFAFICGVRFFLIQRFGDPTSFFADDLAAIVHRILVPFAKGTLETSALFSPHNGDHVILFTRLWEILWFKINGEWDVQLSMLVKAPIFAAAMTLFIHIFTRGLDRGRYAAAAVLTLLFAFPFNYHNLLWAFQSQWDFFFLSVALGWLALLNGRPVLALLCALVSPFTLGAGPILAVSYVPFFLAAAFVRKTWSVRRACGYAGVAIAIAAVGMSFPDGTAAPHTGSGGEKLATLFRLYAWPFSNLLSAVERLPEVSGAIPRRVLNFPSPESSWMLGLADLLRAQPWLLVLIHAVAALLMIGPMAIVAWRVARDRLPLARAIGPLNLCVFASGMIAATAIARANTSTIALRFIDHVTLIGFASVVAAFLLAAEVPRWRLRLAVWGAVIGFGYLATMAATYSQMAQRRNPHVTREAVQAFYRADEASAGEVRTNHAAMLKDGVYERYVMGGDVNEFLNTLDDPELRLVLPRCFFSREASRGRATLVASAVGRGGLLIALGAAAGGAFIYYRERRRLAVSEAGLARSTPVAGV